MKFLRRDSKRYSKLGKNRPKLQKWRKPKGRDNQMRLKRAGYPKNVSVGFKKSRKERGQINGDFPILVKNKNDILKVKEKEIVILSSRLGAKKKLEIIKVAKEQKIKILNLGGKNEVRK